MRRRTWQFFATVALVFACNKEPTGTTDDPVQGATCSNQTKCPGGYKCTNNPADPGSTGKCEYQECGITVPCKTKMSCLADNESAICDERNPAKLCECQVSNSQDVDLTTGGTTPTTGHTP